MLQNNNIKDIEPVKPIPLPRKGLLDQGSNNTIDLSDQESALLQNQAKASQARRDKNSSHSDEKILTVAERTESLKQCGLKI
ncbi:hypothetical protein [Candidatus Mesenet endosymbiont of Phosphuga atrata]|uniref:hypothetical protein n=1 Tax=Candidatus Mesenet endosymbiont of Phosphuga atrata TaxID=3066221 RepID=UPI0030CA9881